MKQKISVFAFCLLFITNMFANSPVTVMSYDDIQKEIAVLKELSKKDRFPSDYRSGGFDKENPHSEISAFIYVYRWDEGTADVYCSLTQGAEFIVYYDKSMKEIKRSKLAGINIDYFFKFVDNTAWIQKRIKYEKVERQAFAEGRKIRERLEAENLAVYGHKDGLAGVEREKREKEQRELKQKEEERLKQDSINLAIKREIEKNEQQRMDSIRNRVDSLLRNDHFDTYLSEYDSLPDDLKKRNLYINKPASFILEYFYQLEADTAYTKINNWEKLGGNYYNMDDNRRDGYSFSYFSPNKRIEIKTIRTYEKLENYRGKANLRQKPPKYYINKLIITEINVIYYEFVEHRNVSKLDVTYRNISPTPISVSSMENELKKIKFSDNYQKHRGEFVETTDDGWIIKISYW